MTHTSKWHTWKWHTIVSDTCTDVSKNRTSVWHTILCHYDTLVFTVCYTLLCSHFMNSLAWWEILTVLWQYMIKLIGKPKHYRQVWITMKMHTHKQVQKIHTESSLLLVISHFINIDALTGGQKGIEDLTHINFHDWLIIIIIMSPY